MASSSAMTTRVAKLVPSFDRCVLARPGLREQPVEQLVLIALQLGDLVEHGGAVPSHGLGMPLGLPMVDVGDGRLGHQGPQPGVVGGIGQMRELLIRDLELGAQLLQATGNLAESPLDQRLGHEGESTAETAQDAMLQAMLAYSEAPC